MSKKQYIIPSRSIHPELRKAGSLIRAFNTVYTEKQLRMQNKFMDMFIKGLWLGRHTRIRQEYIPRQDGSRLRILICTSRKGTDPNATGLLWMHGGGYAIGMPEQDFHFADPFAADGSCVAVLPAYRRSTEAPYPAALEDCYVALCWMKEHAAELGITPDQLFVGGDSAGGGLTAALCLYARDRGQVSIAFQMPLYPMLDDRMITPSSRNNDAPVWNSASNRAAWAMYLRSCMDKGDIPPYAAPARTTDFSNLPPACTYVGDIEPFHDETLAYFNSLKSAGVPVFMRIYKGCFHAFDMMGGNAEVARSARAYRLDMFRYAQQHFFAEQPVL